MSLIRQAAAALSARAGLSRLLYVHYGVTHRCNMRCRMCAVWQDGDASGEMTADEVRCLATELADAGTAMVTLGGGEPFVRHDLAALISAFHDAGNDVRVLTNGIGIDDTRIDSAIAAGLRHVSISLDTLDKEKQKDIYSGQDVWDEIVDTIHRFRERLTTPPSIPIMNVCVSRMNLDELASLVEFAAQQGFCCSFVPVALAPNEDGGDGFAAAAPDMAVRPEDRQRLEAAYGDLLRLKRHGAPIANSARFLRDSLAYLRDGSGRWQCDAGTLYVSVSPGGDISICHRFPPITRFDRPDLSRYLLSRSVRQTAKQTRRQCDGCMRPCWAELTHVAHDLRSSMEALALMRRAPGKPGRELSST